MCGCPLRYCISIRFWEDGKVRLDIHKSSSCVCLHITSIAVQCKMCTCQYLNDTYIFADYIHWLQDKFQSSSECLVCTLNFILWELTYLLWRQLFDVLSAVTRSIRHLWFYIFCSLDENWNELDSCDLVISLLLAHRAAGRMPEVTDLSSQLMI